MVMLGTFLPWKASTLEDIPVVFTISPVEPGLCRLSCWRSFVVVIFVNNPATISMMSVMGIPLISYFTSGSFAVRPRPKRPRGDRNSSPAKLLICARSRTTIVVPSFRTSSTDLVECDKEEWLVGVGDAVMSPGLKGGSDGPRSSYRAELDVLDPAYETSFGLEFGGESGADLADVLSKSA